MANKWIKRIKKAQDNFFDKQITYENYDEVSSFDREYIRAKNITSFSGELCKISGGIGMFLGLLFSAYAFATGSFSAGLSGIGISLALAIAGAPLMALGTIATNSKRQTALIALQTWTNAPID
jgi:hypothetical protein